MVKTAKQLVIISLLTSVIYSISYSYQVTVQNLVEVSTTSSIYTSVPLPSKIKANSNYIPIARINFISLPAESLSGYYIKEISVTVQNVSNFDAATDLLPLSSNGIALFADSTQSNVSTNTWDGISNETEVTTTKYPATWAECGGPSSWTVKLTPTVPNQTQVSSTGNNYTFYICIKTNNSTLISYSKRMPIVMDSFYQISYFYCFFFHIS